MLTTAFGMCAIPFCKQALLLTGLMSVIGMSMGVLDTGELKDLFTWHGGGGGLKVKTGPISSSTFNLNKKMFPKM